MPEPIPVILLGGLAVDLDYQGRGLDGDLIVDACRRALAAAGLIGARALITQALDEGARSSCERFGFRAFSEREPLMLLLRISGLRNVFGGSNPIDE